jgi:hypothetical protein
MYQLWVNATFSVFLVLDIGSDCFFTAVAECAKEVRQTPEVGLPIISVQFL